MIIKNNRKDTEVMELLSLATTNAKEALIEYLESPDKVLYVKYSDCTLVGCIGLDISEKNHLTILHIAVGKPHQDEKNASKMINFIKKKYHPSKIIAETDSEAIGFYQKYGFEISSLGEKYPGVERFRCIFMNG